MSQYERTFCILGLLLAACTLRGSTDQAAIDLVHRYVRLDTMGRHEAADSRDSVCRVNTI